jgi:ADP-ribosylation factor-like protein 3
MGLLDFFRRAKPALKERNVLILGLDNAGKTTLLKRLCDEDISYVMPTQGFNIKSIVNENFKLNAWDLGGQKSVRPYWRHYFEKAQLIIFVIDSADRRRMEESAFELSEVLDEPKLAGIPLLVFANKQDLVGAATPAVIAETMHLPSLRDRPWNIAACSSKTGAGLAEGMAWVTRTLLKEDA